MPWVPGTGGFKHDQRYRTKHRCTAESGHRCRGVYHKWCAMSNRWPHLGFDKKGDAQAQCREWNKEAAEHDKRFGLKGDDE